MSHHNALVSAAASLCLAALVGCQPPAQPDHNAATKVDSAGVAVVTYDKALSGDALRLERVWTHGFSQDDYPFQSVFSGALGHDGSALIGEAGNQEIVRIDPSGDTHMILAPTGEGPGEVKSVRMVRRANDAGFWVEDTGNLRLTRFTEGLPVQTLSLGENQLFRFMPLGIDSSGKLLMATAAYRPGFQQDWLYGHMIGFDPDNNIRDTLGTFPYEQRPTGTGPSPFAATGVISSAGGGFVHGRQDIPELIWRTGGGNIERIVRWKAQEAYPTSDMWAQFVDAMAVDLRRLNPDLTDAELRNAAARQATGWEMDASIPLPLFGQLYGAPNGDAWVSDFAPWNHWTTGFTVFSDSGSDIARAEFDEPFMVLDLLGDLVLGVVRDELGVQAISVFRIH